MVRMFVGGDVVNYTNLSGQIFGAGFEQLLRSVDIAVCNFEAPIQGFGAPRPKVGPHHAQLPSTPSGLASQGINVALLANNHIMDFGTEGLEATRSELRRNGIATIGAGRSWKEATSPLIVERAGCRIGLINVGEAHFGAHDSSSMFDCAGYAWINERGLDARITRLRSECDSVVIFAHAGLEKYPVPLSYWRQRYQELCDAGADVVVGTHPHVPQGFERYDNSWIIYSLGNLYFDSSTYAGSPDASFSVVLNIDKQGGIGLDTFCHDKRTGLTELSAKDSGIDTQSLCAMLEPGAFEAHHSEAVARAYRNYLVQLQMAVGRFPFNPHPTRAVRGLLRRLLTSRSAPDPALVLLHLVRNETYRATAEAYATEVHDSNAPRHRLRGRR